jgi:hypothetical protein
MIRPRGHGRRRNSPAAPRIAEALGLGVPSHEWNLRAENGRWRGRPKNG